MHLKAHMEFVKKHIDDTAGWGTKVLWSDTNLTFGLNSQRDVLASLTLHITKSTPSLLSSMVVAVSCYGAAFHQQGLASLSG